MGPKNISMGLYEVADNPYQVTSEMEQSTTDQPIQLVNSFIDLATHKQEPRTQWQCALQVDLHTALKYLRYCWMENPRPQCHSSHSCSHFWRDSNFDLRKYCPPPYSSTVKAVSIFHTGIPVVVKLSGFQKDAVQFQKFYSQRLDAPGQKNMFSFLACYVDKVNALFMQPQSSGSLPPTEPSLSSLGIIDNSIANKHGDLVEVTDFWLGVDMLSRQLMLYVWTHQGKLQLIACYNKEFYAREFVETFLSDVKDILVKGLGV